MEMPLTHQPETLVIIIAYNGLSAGPLPEPIMTQFIVG